MPEAIAALIVAASGIAAGTAAAAIATAVLTVGLTVGLSALSMAILGTPGTGKPSDVQRTVRVDIGSRVRHYGTVHVGGQLTFEEAKAGTASYLAGITHGALFRVVTTGHGELTEILEHRLNNKPVTVSGGVVLNPQFRNFVRIYERLGTATQTAISELTSQFPEWTANHRQRGCSHVALFFGTPKSKNFSEVYEGSRAPEYTQVVKGAKVYDPRKDSTAGGSGAHRLANPSTWEYSDNAALVIADYLAHDDGYGLGTGAVNWTNIAAEAAICDQTLTTVDARTIKRWRICGSYKLSDDERRTVLTEMRKACDAYIWQDADGLANVMVGRWIAPTVHITDDHIISVAANLEGDPQDRANEVCVIYSDPNFDYAETEAAPQIDVAAQAAVGREATRFDAFYIPDHNQASRVGKRLLRQLSAEWQLTLVCNLYALNLIGERFLTLTIDDLGIASETFEIESFRLMPESNLVEVTVHSASEDDFDFDAVSEEGDPPTEPGDTTATITLDPPTGLTLSGISLVGGGVGIKAVWDEGPAGALYEAQLQLTSGGDVFAMPVDQDAFTAVSSAVTSGAEYTVRVRAYTPYGRESEWAEEAITPPAASSITKAFTLAGNGNVFYRNFDGVSVADQEITLTATRTGTSAAIVVKLYRLEMDGSSTQIDAGAFLTGSGTVTDNSPDANSLTMTGSTVTMTGTQVDLAADAAFGVLVVMECDGMSSQFPISFAIRSGLVTTSDIEGGAITQTAYNDYADARTLSYALTDYRYLMQGAAIVSEGGAIHLHAEMLAWVNYLISGMSAGDEIGVLFAITRASIGAPSISEDLADYVTAGGVVLFQDRLLLKVVYDGTVASGSVTTDKQNLNINYIDADGATGFQWYSIWAKMDGSTGSGNVQTDDAQSMILTEYKR